MVAVADVDREARLIKLYREHREDVLAYLMRRMANAEDAADGFAETFIVAWRRLEDVPEGSAARPWLFGVARNMVLRGTQARRRESALVARISELIGPLMVASTGINHGGDVIKALELLTEVDREILRLTAWESLTPAEAGVVLGVSPNAARIRLHRARKRLKSALETLDVGVVG